MLKRYVEGATLYRELQKISFENFGDDFNQFGKSPPLKIGI